MMSRLFWRTLLAALPATVISASPPWSTNSTYLTNSTTCQAINYQIPGRVIARGTIGYDAAQGSYYSGQERELMPDCIFMPTTAEEVSRFVKTMAKREGRDTLFAIRSGGHTTWRGAANIDGGVTVDMRLMNQTVLSDDGKMASLGSGGRFHDVYHQLSPHNLTVMGGRVPSIGVGGFLSTGKLRYMNS